MARRGENIRKRKDGRWEGRYTEYVAGEKRSKSVYAKTYKEIRQKLMTAKKNISSSKIRHDVTLTEENKQLTISKVSSLWLDEVMKKKKHSTYVKYRNICNKYILPVLGSLTLYNLSTNALTDIFSSELSESMQKSIYCVLNQIMVYGNEHYGTEIIHYNKKKVVSKTDPVKILNTSEQRELLCSLYQDMDYSKLGILICLSTGLRLGEVCALQWNDIDMDAKILHVNRTVQRISIDNAEHKTQLLESTPKTPCSKREIPLSEHLYNLLKKYKNEDKYVVNGDYPMEPRTYQKRLHVYLKQAGILDAHFHTLRHTFATNCISAGADVKSVSEILGHSDVRITLNRYVHPSMDTKRDHLNSLDSIYGQYLGQVS